MTRRPGSGVGSPTASAGPAAGGGSRPAAGRLGPGPPAGHGILDGVRHARHRRSLDDRLLARPDAGRLVLGLAALLLLAGIGCWTLALTRPGLPTPVRVVLGAAGTWGLVVGVTAARSRLPARPGS